MAKKGNASNKIPYKLSAVPSQEEQEVFVRAYKQYQNEPAEYYQSTVLDPTQREAGARLLLEYAFGEKTINAFYDDEKIAQNSNKSELMNDAALYLSHISKDAGKERKFHHVVVDHLVNKWCEYRNNAKAVENSSRETPLPKIIVRKNGINVRPKELKEFDKSVMERREVVFLRDILFAAHNATLETMISNVIKKIHHRVSSENPKQVRAVGTSASLKAVMDTMVDYRPISKFGTALGFRTHQMRDEILEQFEKDGSRSSRFNRRMFSINYTDSDGEKFQDPIDTRADSDPTQEPPKAISWQNLKTEMLAILSEREFKIVTARMGLDSPDGEAKTLRALEGTLGITKERVRQIEHKAINKLREKLPEHYKKLIDDSGQHGR